MYMHNIYNQSLKVLILSSAGIGRYPSLGLESLVLMNERMNEQTKLCSWSWPVNTWKRILGWV